MAHLAIASNTQVVGRGFEQLPEGEALTSTI